MPLWKRPKGALLTLIIERRARQKLPSMTQTQCVLIKQSSARPTPCIARLQHCEKLFSLKTLNLMTFALVFRKNTRTCMCTHTHTHARARTHRHTHSGMEEGEEKEEKGKKKKEGRYYRLAGLSNRKLFQTILIASIRA